MPLLIAKKIRQYLYVTLAVTWKQPNTHFTLADDEISLNQLNDDCLIETFQRLDLQSLLNLICVCERFKISYHPTYFPIKTKHQLKHKIKTRKTSTTHTICLEYSWKCFATCRQKRATTKFYSFHWCIFKKFKNPKQSELVHVFMTERLHEQLKLILNQLKVLKYRSTQYYQHVYEFDLVNYCPRLKKFHSHAYMNLNINSAKWKPLESFTFTDFYRSNFCYQFIEGKALDAIPVNPNSIEENIAALQKSLILLDDHWSLEVSLMTLPKKWPWIKQLKCADPQLERILSNRC